MHQGCSGAHWQVTDYKGEVGPSGRITNDACDLLIGLGDAYLKLLHIGADGCDASGLYGPSSGKCASCGFLADCKYRKLKSETEQERPEKKIWIKYAKGKAK